MGRQKRLMMKIDNPCSRYTTYSKRRDGILKKASELSVLCDADVGLLMFSPSGRLTSFASNGRVEDVFLRYYFYQRLRELKHEGEMLEKLSKIYNPDLKNITSVHEAQVYQQFLTDSLRHVEKLKEELLGKQIIVQESGTVEVTWLERTENTIWNSTANDHDQPKTT
ncbi:hypothetical protein FEM48_Zijuj04G0083400 [Ziziphus jujuba var. spinosa]|uniref:MADS-box domain-containing protein n=1 Tax=Ziziphus jujuba var. spinosa TaxID=714518 RepID=A0A978VIT3_ZIZJJ|nr:hypothetical protein FEM48_Zijuj04G0083400 [Ziziphus jujuba var. spinosa]